MRAETRRSVGGVAALIPSIVSDRERPGHAGFTDWAGPVEPLNTRPDPGPGQAIFQRAGRERHFLFDDRPRTTYTLPSLAFSSRHRTRCTSGIRSDAVRWGTHKGS
ncbi:hypothetical protein GCM10010508_53670 [Streptomyces naganishii JCM 4654]|uniref:Uncharacterized protein n=1 Tax=Streptomyces naganishii JCM 4654 TaxID=1306179 RepID=A0A918Y9N2_9ACTN|nr:hypothetical protein GCM10010508_53670 [Streptomyces naganishii JCM 4654]